jgi:hypothetical protein
MEKEILDFRQKIEFFRVKMQELVSINVLSFFSKLICHWMCVLVIVAGDLNFFFTLVHARLYTRADVTIAHRLNEITERTSADKRETYFGCSACMCISPHLSFYILCSQ